MNSRQTSAAHSMAAAPEKTLLLDLEMPRTTAFEAFEVRLDSQLAALETRFSDFVTPNSFSGSISRPGSAQSNKFD